MTWLPRSLFGRSAAILALTLLVFTLLAVAATAWLVVFPVGKRSADDFAALMVLVAQTWVEVPPDTRPDLRRELQQQHRLKVADEHLPLTGRPFPVPYLAFLEAALERRSGQTVTVMASDDETLWADIAVPAGVVRIGFERQRVGADPARVFVLMLGFGVLLTLVAAIGVARLVVRPLEQLTTAAGEVGHGRIPSALPASGANEIVVLTRAFNRMSVQVTELLENRTVLLSGISHDLRTPLTRLRLALEMLEPDTDANADLAARMRSDLEAMDTLIGQMLELARDLIEVRGEPVELRELIEALLADARRDGTRLSLEAPTICSVHGAPTLLSRILTNLLDNAIRYGGGHLIDVELDCEEDGAVIRVCDRGPGVPEQQREAVFRPFHRLEAARGRDTGGTGLGLAIARQLADRQGWELRLLAREGGGTVAQLTLPPSTAPPSQ